MKILQITKRYTPYIGGIEQLTEDISDSLPKCEQEIICFNHNKGTVTEQIKNAKVTRVSCPITISSQPIAKGYGKILKKTINEFKPDIVIFHFPNPFASHYLLKYCKKKKFKLITYYHADIVKQKFLKIFFNSQSKKLLKYSDKIIATSPNYIDKSEYLQLYKDKCVVVPSCVNTNRLGKADINKVNEIKNEYKDKIICFAVGRLVPYKGIEYLIRASKLLDDRFRIFIGGAGPLEQELKKLASGDNKIKFLGRVKEEDLKAYFEACDIYCFPSITKNEAFGLSLAEAMYYYKPAITFTIPGSGVNYVNINNITGIEVENRNYKEYAKAIIKLAEDNTLRKEYGINANKRVNELFTFDKFKDNINNVIKEISNK